VDNVEKVIRTYYFNEFMKSLAFDENPARKYFIALFWARKRYRELSVQERTILYKQLKG
jgi:hypothetical protein